MNAEGPTSGASGFARFLIVLLLLLAVGGFGLATLCGAVFTFMSIGGGEYVGGAWVIAVPSLLIGGWLCWLCGRQLLRVLRRKA
ncbi:hypothetical protein [Ideonella sp.]|uniref:hypothetical protein n=1 Tax=Ideonella sp. TaxID=1929293 RepID=UPI002B46C265|nr:hypothetical protein [Ideonella sp.]HJV67835.1 hypothetical protein [Ideonella sp.]